MVRDLSAPERPSRIPGGPDEQLDELQRRPREPADAADVRYVAAHDTLHGAPDDARAGKRERASREAVERHLDAPGGPQVSGEALRQARAVRIETQGPSGEDVEGRIHGVLRAQEPLEHPISRDRVDQAGRVADDERASTRERGARRAERQPVPANLLEVGGGHPVRLAESPQMVAERRSFSYPAPHA